MTSRILADMALGLVSALVAVFLFVGRPERPPSPDPFAIALPPPPPEPSVPPLGRTRHELAYCAVPFRSVAIPCREADAITGGERDI